ncbi:hypothetical protein D3C72_1487840 [compost metagenome]
MACLPCHTRPCRRWPRWRATRRWCWPYPTRASSTGATSSMGATCCARKTSASASATAPTWPGFRSRNCMRTATRCWPAGAGKGAISSVCSTNSTNTRKPRGATTACASTCLARKRARPCCSRCRWPSANCVRWPSMSKRRPMPATARSNFMWRTACSAKWKCCTTSCWPCSRTAPTRVCVRATWW